MKREGTIGDMLQHNLKRGCLPNDPLAGKNIYGVLTAYACHDITKRASTQACEMQCVGLSGLFQVRTETTSNTRLA